MTGPLRTTAHHISPSDIDEDAHKVLRRLEHFGYHAYLVGGGVRDVLLGRKPKDFDVATSARPSEVNQLFRNCRLIGRRFRLAHILFAGGHVIETATFRAKPTVDDSGNPLITDDNEFGTPETDAYRRDFTVNGLFYEPATEEVIDYVGGLKDLERRVIRTIGEPVLRFREDPIRMLRAIKFAARLNFSIDEATAAAIRSERGELAKAAIPRLIEEILRMLWGGAAAQSMELLAEYGLLDLMLPEIAAMLGRGGDDAWAPARGLLDALNLKCNGQPAMENGVLLATLFWPLYQALTQAMPARLDHSCYRVLAEALVAPAALRLRIPKRDVTTLVAVLEGHTQFPEFMTDPRRRATFARGSNFPSMIDFFELRAEAEHLPAAELEAWRALATECPPPSFEARQEAHREARREARRNRPQRRRR